MTPNSPALPRSLCHRTGNRLLCLLRLTLLATFCSVPPTLQAQTSTAGTVLGWLEWAYLPVVEQTLPAKLDSGADYASLHATDIRAHRIAGQHWVCFTTLQSHPLCLPRVRITQIKQKQGPAQSRPVVAMPLCLNGRWQHTVFNLVDRSGFAQPLLLGRDALADGLLIDPNRTHLSPKPRLQNRALWHRPDAFAIDDCAGVSEAGF